MHLDVLSRALIAVAPVALGRKTCLDMIGQMMVVLRKGIPENGIGPEVSDRRAALQFLESRCRTCEHIGKCWKHGLRLGD